VASVLDYSYKQSIGKPLRYLGGLLANRPLLIALTSAFFGGSPAGIPIQDLLAYGQRENLFQLPVSQRPKRCPAEPKAGLTAEAPSSEQPASKNPI
jgi:hypothetical protein